MDRPRVRRARRRHGRRAGAGPRSSSPATSSTATSRELAPHVEPLARLRARDGVYAVTGNHEYYWDADAWIAHLGSLGLRYLHNERVAIAGAFELAGTDDNTAGEDIPRATAGRDPALPLVLLAHHPSSLPGARAAGVDLQLSGHTHGGQMLPLGYLARLFEPHVAGLARFGDTWLYVSEGTGFWGPPIRVGTSCEIAAITLVRRGELSRHVLPARQGLRVRATRVRAVAPARAVLVRLACCSPCCRPWWCTS